MSRPYTGTFGAHCGVERLNPMVVTRNMTMEDPIEMIRMLQQKMEEMQRNHEEVAAVKA